MFNKIKIRKENKFKINFTTSSLGASTGFLKKDLIIIADY